MKRKVLVDLLNLATPKIAGVGFFAKNLFEIWLKEDDLPYSVTFYSSSQINAADVFQIPEKPHKISVYKTNVQHVLARFLYQQLILPFHLLKYDLYYNPAVGLPFLARIISPKTKLITTVHDMTPFFYKKKYSPLRTALVKILSKNVVKAAHHVVTVSQNSKKDIANITKVATEKISIVYNFIPGEYELDNKNDKNYFLCISTIEPGKNIENSIKGFARFRSEELGNNYKFYWIGRIGWVYNIDFINSLIEANNVSDSFILLGYIDDDKKREWLKNASAIVYLSHYEGFGLPIIEGMTFNKPSLVSMTSSLPEVAGESGVYCDQNDPNSIAESMKILINKMPELKKNIPHQLACFSPEMQRQKFIKIIHEQLFGHGYNS